MIGDTGDNLRMSADYLSGKISGTHFETEVTFALVLTQFKRCRFQRESDSNNAVSKASPNFLSPALLFVGSTMIITWIWHPESSKQSY